MLNKIREFIGLREWDYVKRNIFFKKLEVMSFYDNTIKDN